MKKISYAKLRNLAEERGLSQLDIVRICDLSPSTINSLFNERYDPRLSTLLKLCSGLDCQLEDIVEFVD